MTFLSVGDGDFEMIRIVVVITVHFTAVIRSDITLMCIMVYGGASIVSSIGDENIQYDIEGSTGKKDQA